MTARRTGSKKRTGSKGRRALSPAQQRKKDLAERRAERKATKAARKAKAAEIAKEKKAERKQVKAEQKAVREANEKQHKMEVRERKKDRTAIRNMNKQVLCVVITGLCPLPASRIPPATVKRCNQNAPRLNDDTPNKT